MTEDVAEAFAVAEEAALRASAPLAVAMGLTVPDIYAGVVPTNAPLPYVLIGQHQVLDDDDEDDDCPLGAEIHSTVHVWTKPEAPQNLQARRILRAVQKALNRDLVLDGHRVISHAAEDKQFITDPDQSTHGFMTLRFDTEPL